MIRKFNIYSFFYKGESTIIEITILLYLIINIVSTINNDK